MSTRASQIRLAAGISALTIAAPMGVVALHEETGSVIGPLSANSTIIDTTTPPTVPATSMAVPTIKGPAALPPEEQGLP
jgi:hypothetical protein